MHIYYRKDGTNDVQVLGKGITIELDFGEFFGLTPI